MNPLAKFEAIKMDVLKEVGNIGAGNAATALSRLVGQASRYGCSKSQFATV